MNEKEVESEGDMIPMKPYASDLSDAEWAILEPLIPPAKKGGPPQKREYAADSQWDLLCPVSKDYEYLTSSSEAMVYLTMLRLMLRRLAKQSEQQFVTYKQTHAA